MERRQLTVLPRTNPRDNQVSNAEIILMIGNTDIYFWWLEMMAYTYYRGSTPNSKIYIICFYTSIKLHITIQPNINFFFLEDLAMILLLLMRMLSITINLFYFEGESCIENVCRNLQTL